MHRRYAAALAAIFSLTGAQAAFAAHGSGDMAVTAGNYRCELHKSVTVHQVSADGQSAVLGWENKKYTMTAVSTASGALRYEDRSAGLVWITIPGKSMLLDSKQGHQLANECKV